MNKSFTAALKKYNHNERYPTSEDEMKGHVRRYINAIRDGRMICSIDSVSASGMSRTMKFVEVSKARRGERSNVLNFYQLFDFLGHTKVRDSDYFRVGGCGMDMVFHTNYTNIRSLASYGLISAKQAAVLAQQTPSVI